MNARNWAATDASIRRLRAFREQQERAPKTVQPFDEPPYRVPRWAHVGWRKRWQVSKASRDAAPVVRAVRRAR